MKYRNVATAFRKHVAVRWRSAPDGACNCESADEKTKTGPLLEKLLLNGWQLGVERP